MTTDNVDCDHDTVREGVKSWMESVRSTAASASASSSLASQHFLVKILGHASVLRRLVSSSRNGDKIITAMSIPISSFLSVSQSLLSFQKRYRSKHDSTGPRLRNTVVFGSGDNIGRLLIPESALYYCSHAAVLLGHLILGGVILSICRRSGGCEGRGGGMNAALPYRQTILHIVTISLLELCSSYIRYADSSDAH